MQIVVFNINECYENKREKMLSIEEVERIVMLCIKPNIRYYAFKYFNKKSIMFPFFLALH